MMLDAMYSAASGALAIVTFFGIIGASCYIIAWGFFLFGNWLERKYK